MFIDPNVLFEFKLRRSEMYTAPPELWILGIGASYKHRAPNGAEDR
jgi:hypothetical protein